MGLVRPEGKQDLETESVDIHPSGDGLATHARILEPETKRFFHGVVTREDGKPLSFVDSAVWGFGPIETRPDTVELEELEVTIHVRTTRSEVVRLRTHHSINERNHRGG